MNAGEAGQLATVLVAVVVAIAAVARLLAPTTARAATTNPDQLALARAADRGPVVPWNSEDRPGDTAEQADTAQDALEDAAESESHATVVAEVLDALVVACWERDPTCRTCLEAVDAPDDAITVSPGRRNAGTFLVHRGDCHVAALRREVDLIQRGGRRRR